MANLMETLTNKKFQTRIALKYDTFANWTSKNPVLLAGEIALATVPVGTTTTPAFQNLPNVVAKVGDGEHNYNDLPFLSALSADVYSWAKAESKPVYSANEIEGLSDYIADVTTVDTNTQYKIEAVEGSSYKYELKYKEKDGEYTSFDPASYIDLSNLASAEEAIDTLKGDVNTDGSVAHTVQAAIEGLKVVGEESQPSRTVKTISQTDGTVEVVYQDIAIATSQITDFADVRKEWEDGDSALEKRVKTNEDNIATLKGDVNTDGSVANTVKTAIDNLDVAEVAGSQAAGTTVSFISKISQTDGAIAASLGELKFKSTYDPETNKVATIADIQKEFSGIAGALEFKGVLQALPTDNTDYNKGDIILIGSKEYVFDGTSWIELGDESLVGTAIESLDSNLQIVSKAADGTTSPIVDSVITEIVQEDGLLKSFTTQKIKIAQDQVTGLTDALANMDATLGVSDLEKRVEANEAAIDILKGNDETTGSVAYTVKDAIANLDNADTEVAGEYVSAVRQTDGVITVSRKPLPATPAVEVAAVTPNIDVSNSTTIDVVAKVERDSTNDHKLNVTKATVLTEKGLNDVISNLDADIQVEPYTADEKHFNVATGVKEEDGVITKVYAKTLHKVAETGRVDDLDQTNYIIFNCGSSTVNI